MKRDSRLELARKQRVVSLAKKEGWAMGEAKTRRPPEFEPVERLLGK